MPNVKVAKQTRHVSNRAEVERKLQGLLDGFLAQKRTRYAVVAVESGDQSFRWVSAGGQAQPDGTPMTPGTPFWMASVTKLYIAAAVMILHEQGRLSIDEPMARYLPEELIFGLHQMDGVDYTGQITVRNLLEHSSGLPDYLEVHAPGGKNLFQRVLEEGDRSWTIPDKLQIVREANQPLFPPQPPHIRKKRVRYSDTGFQLLIAIIEQVTGTTVAQAFQEMIYRPLGLEQTFHPGSYPAQSVPTEATLWHEDQPLHLPLGLRSFGDLNATIADMLKFMRGLVRGHLFDDPATFHLMIGQWHQFPFSLNLTPVAPGWPIEYGLGMMRMRIPRLFTPLRPVPETIGHTGVCGAWLFYCPSLDLYLAGSGSGQLVDGPTPFRLVPKMLHALAALA